MGAILGQAEVSGQSAEFGLLGFAVDVDPPDGVPFLNVIHVLEEVQIQVEAVRCFQGVGEAAGLLPIPIGQGWLAGCWNNQRERKKYRMLVDQKQTEK